MCCSVAFSKICPAGKGYFLQNIRETFPVAFPPIFPRKPNKEGESSDTLHTTQESANISAFVVTMSQVNSHSWYPSISFPCRAKAAGKMLFLCLIINTFKCLLLWSLIISFNQETVTSVQQSPTSTSSPRVPGKHTSPVRFILHNSSDRTCWNTMKMHSLLVLITLQLSQRGESFYSKNMFPMCSEDTNIRTKVQHVIFPLKSVHLISLLLDPQLLSPPLQQSSEWPPAMTPSKHRLKSCVSSLQTDSNISSALTW